jgi:cyclin B
MYSKRKAEGSPGRNDRAKRSALTNLTNQVKQSDSDENLKKVNAFGVKDENALKPVGVRTRASAAAVFNQSKTLKPTAQITAKKSNENMKQEIVTQNIDLVTVFKSRHSEIATKPATKTRRISNEFEKTEESLYVSALEDIPGDASLRLSDIHKKKSSISIADVKLHIHPSKSDETLKPDSQDIYEDAQDEDQLQRDRKLPPGVQHFDRENWNDPYQVSHYTMDIFDYLTQQEHKYQIRDYIGDQPELSKWMRSLLVDWMVEVQESFELNHETLYLSVKIVDSFLGKEKVSKDSLQLVGAAALLIACKYDVSNLFNRINFYLNFYLFYLEKGMKPEDCQEFPYKYLNHLINSL